VEMSVIFVNIIAGSLMVYYEMGFIGIEFYPEYSNLEKVFAIVGIQKNFPIYLRSSKNR
jgi:hypothetical protein